MPRSHARLARRDYLLSPRRQRPIFKFIRSFVYFCHHFYTGKRRAPLHASTANAISAARHAISTTPRRHSRAVATSYRAAKNTTSREYAAECCHRVKRHASRALISFIFTEAMKRRASHRQNAPVAQHARARYVIRDARYHHHEWRFHHRRRSAASRRAACRRAARISGLPRDGSRPTHRTRSRAANRTVIRSGPFHARGADELRADKDEGRGRSIDATRALGCKETWVEAMRHGRTAGHMPPNARRSFITSKTRGIGTNIEVSIAILVIVTFESRYHPLSENVGVALLYRLRLPLAGILYYRYTFQDIYTYACCFFVL